MFFFLRGTEEPDRLYDSSNEFLRPRALHLRAGTSHKHTKVIAQILHLIHLLDGQWRRDKTGEIYCIDFKKKKSWLTQDFKPLTLRPMLSFLPFITVALGATDLRGHQPSLLAEA